MTQFICFLVIFYFSMLLCGYSDGNTESPPEKNTESQQKLRIRGIVLLPSSQEIATVDKKVGHVLFHNLTIPGKPENLRRELQAQFLNRPITPETLTEIKKKILSYYQKWDHPVVSAFIPEQDITDGILFIVVCEAKIGKITYTGNNWYSDSKIKRYFNIESGQAISRETLLNSAAWSNRNPFHYTEVSLSAGEKEGTTDVELITRDRFPLRLYGGADNTGNSFTGNIRLFAGLNWGNVFGRGDLLSYQFTCEPHLDLFMSHYGSFTSFLPWQHIFNLCGGYSTTHPDFHRDFKGHGKFGQASLRYTIPFHPLYQRLAQQISAGIDYKYLNNNLFFEGDKHNLVITNSVNVSQLILSYSLSALYDTHEVQMSLEGFFSPGHILSHQSNKAYSALRAHSKNLYFYSRATLSDTWKFSKLTLAGLLRIQGSTASLLPSEQFGLGGYNSIRGYNEQAFIADQAVCANIELRAPSLPINHRIHDGLTFLAFIDYGWGYNLHSLSGERSNQHLLGIGPGLRYSIGRYLALRADYGFQILKVQFSPKRLGKFHLGGTLNF